MISSKRKAAIVAHTKELINGVIDWYTTGAVDCPETRRNINADLDSILPRVQEKFGLRKIKKVLRVRGFKDGQYLIRLEEPGLN